MSASYFNGGLGNWASTQLPYCLCSQFFSAPMDQRHTSRALSSLPSLSHFSVKGLCSVPWKRMCSFPNQSYTRTASDPWSVPSVTSELCLLTREPPLFTPVRVDFPPTFSHTAPTSPAHCPRPSSSLRSLWKLPPLYKLRGFYRGDHNTTRNKNVWNHKHDLCSPWVSKGMNSDTCFITHSRERNSPWVAQALGPRKRSWFLFQCPSLPTPSHLFLELQVGPEPSGHQQRMGKALLFTGKNEDFSPAQLHYTAYHRDGTEIPT